MSENPEPLDFVLDADLREAIRCSAGISSRLKEISFEEELQEIEQKARDTGSLFIDKSDLALCGFDQEQIDRVVLETENVEDLDDEIRITVPRPTIREARKIRKDERLKKAGVRLEAIAKARGEIGEDLSDTISAVRSKPVGKKRVEVKVGAGKIRTTIKKTREELKEERPMRFVRPEKPREPRKIKPPIIKGLPEPIPGVPFDFINSEELRVIIICILERIFAEENITTLTVEQFIDKQSLAVENTGFFNTSIPEWVGCSTVQQLGKFEALRLLQVLEGPEAGEFKEIVIPTKLPRDIITTPDRIGESIRNWLLLNETGSASEFWRFVWRRVRPTSSYKAVAHMFYILRQIKLIERTSVKTWTLFDKDHHGTDAQVFYRIVPGKEGDPTWMRGQQELYAATIVGGRRYEKFKEENLIEFGRNERFA